MKKFTRIFLTLTPTMLLLSLTSVCQIQNSALVAKFGIDGDLYSDYRQNGTFTAAGSHDWFKTNNGTGRGVIDTTGATMLKTLLSNGNNISFTRGSAIPRFSVVDTFLHMDAIYGRDYNNNDKTSFASGSKNGDDPSVWSTTPSGGMVQDKSDLIDAYAGMRRDGTTINNPNPSHVILSMGSTILSTSGNRYVDFELFVNRLAYDSVTGKFSNGGSSAKGGHEDFQFNTDGSLKKIGDIDVSLTYSSTNVTDISIYIWVSEATYSNTYGQQKFNFVPGEFYGAGNNATYGYAKIIAKTGYTLPLWGSVNSAMIAGPVWGTASKDLGTSVNNYFTEFNSVSQFSETAVDLTSIGIDPAFNNTAGNSCNPAFTRIIIKTRSSASFTAALSDFAGPYPFLDAPSVAATIVSPAPLTCSKSQTQLIPSVIDQGRYYNWSTSTGNIVGKADTSSITVNKAGKYYLSTAAAPGCPQNTDSVTVGLDNYKPVASASSIGIIDQSFTTTVLLLGGDTARSNYATPFGGSQGLLWSWTNAKGFSSLIQNPVTTDSGWHQLVVTEKRNGCKDTAKTYVLYSAQKTLAIIFGTLKATFAANLQVNVQWTMQTEEGTDHYEIERSNDGINFTQVYKVGANTQNNSAYYYSDDVRNGLSATLYYRVKIVLTTGKSQYSYIAKVASKEQENNNYVTGIYQSSSEKVRVNFYTKKATDVAIRMEDMYGRMLASSTQKSSPGNNTVHIENYSTGLHNQTVLVQVFMGNDRVVKKIILF
ncbi:MAG: hypothetical protein JWR61_3793 [Ferruginibacter sp.]|uniref:hypothetical protein n=1 Tax=Ferruginibacter sp. TaxID=1940288 RepID=UPI00265A1AB5|nr:hypothetical protein [Ferruginibacter sp.]MDB5278838.1 hypothetical protein [Ferruginibacter sp.]